MPLFLCCVLLIVPASTSHLLSDTASVEQAQLDVIVVHGMFLISCRIKYWARVELDSVLLIDTFFVLFRSFGVDTQG